MLVEADPDEVDNVAVVELAHDERLHEEVHLGLVGAQLRQRLHGHRHVHRVPAVLLVQTLVHLAEGALTQGPK